jgi:glutamate formiminotransferase
MALIECIPNVSEGRRPDVIEECARAIRATPARLLDVHSDPAHHRTVYTFAGEAAAVHEGILALFERAVARIDLRRHTGEHPRVGAVDVVPFVPIEGASMADCVALARAVGAEVADRYALPVFLYEEAAASPERRNLEDIRRGQFEGLSEKMTRPEWQPDFGPSRPHPTAGASVIGARRPLIAFNVNLRTTDLATARAIAAAVRQSSGGLPCVKAMGVTLADRGMVQVSMNLTDYERTPMLQVFDRIKAEAGRLHVSIVSTEIVGLVPTAALPESAARVLQLDEHFGLNQILEERLRKAASPQGREPGS